MGVFIIAQGKYDGENSIRNVIRYILNPQKNPHKIFHAIGISNEDIEKTVKYFVKVQNKWGNTKGKRVLHFIISFSDNEQFSYKTYRHIGYKFAALFEDNYQFIFGFHEFDNNGNKENPHIHFAINPISYKNGKRMKINKKEIYQINAYLNTIISDCKKHQIFPL